MTARYSRPWSAGVAAASCVGGTVVAARACPTVSSVSVALGQMADADQGYDAPTSTVYPIVDQSTSDWGSASVSSVSTSLPMTAAALVQVSGSPSSW